MFPDPRPLGIENWKDIGLWLLLLEIYLPLIVTFAFTMLTAHAIIPSLIGTGHLPARAAKARVPLTAFALLVLVAAVIVMVGVIASTLDVYKFWDRLLI